MKLTAAVLADLAVSPRGLANRALNEVAGKPMLEHLLGRIKASKLFDSVVIATTAASESRLVDLAKRTGCRLAVFHGTDLPYRDLFRAARKWSPDNWRGGLGQTFVYDEEGIPQQLLEIVRDEKADGVMKISGATPFFDAQLVSDMLAEFAKGLNKTGTVFPQLTAGFAYELFMKDVLEQYAAYGITPRNMLRYAPDETKLDALNLACLFSMQEKVLLNSARLLADSQRGWERIQGIFATAGDRALEWGLNETTDFFIAHPEALWGRLPEEVEVEITTGQNIRNMLRPPPPRCASAVQMSMEQFKRLVDELSEYDDVRMSFAGFGEPLLHPQFFDMVRYAKDHGIFGLHLHTNGLLLTRDTADRLLDAPLDVVTVGLDAYRAETYRAITGTGHFEEVCGNVANFVRRRQERGTRMPMIVAEFVKANENIEDMEDFFDHWGFGRVDDAVIKGFNNYCGQVEDRAVLHLNLVERQVCRSLRKRLVVYADGSIPHCLQDWEAKHCAARLGQAPLQEVWRKSPLETLRRAHARGDYATGPLCGACTEWDHL